jgi:hypothetical protein
MATKRTTIHDGDNSAGVLHIDCDDRFENRVFLHMGCGGFSHCTGLSSDEARKMAEALLKAAYAIEAAQPQVGEAT